MDKTTKIVPAGLASLALCIGAACLTTMDASAASGDPADTLCAPLSCGK